jgi:hypothetical protein
VFLSVREFNLIGVVFHQRAQQAEHVRQTLDSNRGEWRGLNIHFGGVIMFRSIVVPLSLTVIVLTSGNSVADDFSLKCSGTIASFRGSLWARDNEEIGVRLSSDRISFVGNKFLSGEGVMICAHEEGDIYFDNNCDQTLTPDIRRSGVFDKFLMTLSLSNTGRNVGVNGTFTCKEINIASAP